MRAHEFVVEAKKKSKIPKMHPWHEGPSSGSYRFIDDATDRTYHLNRIMMAAAMADGNTNKPVELDDQSFAGKNNMAYPYTKVEHNMMKQAFKSVNPHQETTLVGDHRSIEPDDTQKISPVSSFRGYKKKK
jgi:hypothetical protein